MNSTSRPPSLVYKIAPRGAWEDALASGHFHGSADDLRDGYIHLSTDAQVAATLARHFRGQKDLVIVAFEAAALGAGLKWEPSRGGALFPHHYAPLVASQAVWVMALHTGPDGVPVAPQELAAC